MPIANGLVHLPGVAGIDEAGRGPLAGPVVAAAVVLPPEFEAEELADSKQVEPGLREALAIRIRAEAKWAVAVAEASEIDRLNILGATLAAMGRAAEALSIRPLRGIVDGNRLPQGLPWPAQAEVKADARYACVAAASILAKVERDRIMRAYGRLFPEYGFEHHFGYATPEHLEALARCGPCAIHRRSFRPIRGSVQLCLILDA